MKKNSYYEYFFRVQIFLVIIYAGYYIIDYINILIVYHIWQGNHSGTWGTPKSLSLIILIFTIWLGFLIGLLELYRFKKFGWIICNCFLIPYITYHFIDIFFFNFDNLLISLSLNSDKRFLVRYSIYFLSYLIFLVCFCVFINLKRSRFLYNSYRPHLAQV